MQIPVQVTFRDMHHSDLIEADIEERAGRLERFYDKITSCRVVVSAPHVRQHGGQLYRVAIELTVPGKEIVVNRDPGLDHAHEDLKVALRDAFSAAQRRLQDYVRERRGYVKAHEVPDHGRVARLGDEFGFIETADGQELYFHRNSVLQEHFDDLEVGSEVRYVSEPGEKGLQATSVRAVGRHHHLG
ncbi:MAG: HPF/RaiA family ribosome-associated protein [Planctomycetota bacterium]|jgi:cold shock CspA family protein/ribosome-associated translation inhibitor RaiA